MWRVAEKGNKVIDDPRLWRQRALEAEARAKAESNLIVRRRLLRIANSYKRVADYLVEESVMRSASKHKP
jgi:hypothetical protein